MWGLQSPIISFFELTFCTIQKIYFVWLTLSSTKFVKLYAINVHEKVIIFQKWVLGLQSKRLLRVGGDDLEAERSWIYKPFKLSSECNQYNTPAPKRNSSPTYQWHNCLVISLIITLNDETCVYKDGFILTIQTIKIQTHYIIYQRQ